MIRTTFRLGALSRYFFAARKIENIKGSDALEKIVKGSKNNILLDFYADWCGPCKSLGPRLEKQIEGKDNWTLLKINID